MMSSLKNTIDIEINSSIYNFSCSLKRRITVIKGDSGTGKTAVVQILASRPTGFTITSPLDLIPVNAANWKTLLLTSHDAVLFFDDLYYTESMEFISLCTHNLVPNNLYVVLITRHEILNAELKSDLKEDSKVAGMLSKLSISVDEIYNFKTDGINHWLEPVTIPTTDDYSDVDCILVEDTGRGAEFFKVYLKNVISASNGKSNLVTDTLDLITEKNKILVMVDLAGYGCHWDEFTQRVIRKNPNVFILQNRECFEQMLLYSNMLKDIPKVKRELSDLVKYANNYISWETYFERLISDVTENKLYRCNYSRHAVLADCYLKDCSSCHIKKKEKCDAYLKNLNDNKFTVLFKDTIFEHLLDLPRRKIEVTTMELF